MSLSSSASRTPSPSSTAASHSATTNGTTGNPTTTNGGGILPLTGPVSVGDHMYSRKVFVGGLPPDIDEGIPIIVFSL